MFAHDNEDFVECFEEDVSSEIIFDVIVQPKLEVKLTSLQSSGAVVRNNVRLLTSQDRADITFRFSDDRGISAHKLILFANAPDFLDNVEGMSDTEAGGECTIVRMKEEKCSHELLYHILRYVYGGGLPNGGYLLKHAEELIDAASSLDVHGLKLEVEAALVGARVIGTDNAVHYLTFAHEKACDLLKEQALSVTAARFHDVEDISELDKKLMFEVATYLAPKTGAQKSAYSGLKELDKRGELPLRPSKKQRTG